MRPILVVDESPSIRETLAIVLGREHHISTASAVESMTGAEPPALVILGLPPATRERRTLDAALAAFDDRVPLLLLDRPSRAATTRLRNARRRVSVVAKPFDLHVLRAAVTRALEPVDEVTGEATDAPSAAPERPRYLRHPYVSRHCERSVDALATTDFPVLLVGETGTLASEIARDLHTIRGRRGAFATRPATVLDDSELREALAAARGGTLFVGDVHAAPPAAQQALLTVALEQRHADEPVGTHLVVGTRQPLDQLVAAGRCPAELAYALETTALWLTPLRERADDIPVLVERETARLARRLGCGPVTMSPAAVDRMRNYLWFGNVTELEAVIARTLIYRRSSVIEAVDVLFLPEDGAHADDAALAARAPDAPAPTAPLEQPRASGNGETPSATRRTRSLHAVASSMPTDDDSRVSGAGASLPDMPSLEVLVGELAHELRNPMVTIKTFAQHLDSVLADPEERARFASLTGEAITRMDTLLETLLDFARFRTPQPRPLELRDLMDRALAEHAAELDRKGVRVERNGTAAGTIIADESQLFFAFRTLVAGLLPDLVPHEPLRLSVRGRAALSLTIATDRTVAQRLAELVGGGADAAPGEALPLTLALAAALIRRNGGTLDTAGSTDGRTAITVAWAEQQRQGV